MTSNAASSSWADRGLAASPVPSDPRHLHEFVAERLRIPIEVPRPDEDWSLTEQIVAIWKSVVEGCQVDDEASYIDPDVRSSDGFIDSLFLHDIDPAGPTSTRDKVDEERMIAHNIAGWYDGARAELLRRTRLMRVPVAGPEDYPKHYPDAGCRSIADLKTRSAQMREGAPVSVLRFGFDHETVQETVHQATAEFADELVEACEGSVFRGFVDSMIDIGYTAGEATQILCVEWSPQNAHIYPVARSEITGRLVGLGDAQEFVRDTP